MAKVNPNHGNETRYGIFFHWSQNTNMTFVIAIFQFHCKSEHKQVKGNKIKREIFKSGFIFPYLQSITVFV